jgi:capsular polysaccharide biosynthesis protein
MLATPSNSSTATSGTDAPLKYVKTDMPAQASEEVGSVAVVAALVAVAVTAEDSAVVEDLAVAVADMAMADAEEAMVVEEVAVDSKADQALPLSSQTLSPILPHQARNLARSFTFAT